MKRKLMALILGVIMLLSFHSTASAAVQDWKIAKGFGTVKGTGAGLSMDGENLVVNGYGEMAYNLESVEEAVAIQFKINAFPTVTHYFYFGVMNTKQMMWEYAGTKAKGIVTRLVVSKDGQTLTGTAVNTGATGSLVVNNANSPLKAVEASHMLVYYKDADNWNVVLDGVEIARIPQKSTSLGAKGHLIAGSYSSSTMEMEIDAVFTDKEVTPEMKDGTYAAAASGDSGKVDIYYDDEGRLIVGDTIITGNVENPGYAVSQLQVITEGWGKTWVPYLAIAAGVTGILSVVVIVLDKKKKSGKKEVPHEE